MSKEKGGYHFELGEKGKGRLEIINKLHNESSCNFLLKMGLTPGSKVLDLGCGIGKMAIWLAQQVGPSGKVIAIDKSEEQIKISKEAAEEAKVYIEFHTIPVSDIDTLNLSGKIDFVFARFFFMHLAVDEHQPTLNNVKNVLKPETGIIVLQEHIFSRMFSYPESDALKQLISLAAKLNKHLSKDNNLGLKLVELYKNVGLKVLDYQYNDSLAKTKDERLIFYKSLEEGTSALLKFNLATKEEIENTKKGLIDLAEAENYLVGGMPTVIVGGMINLGNDTDLGIVGEVPAASSDLVG